MSSKLDTTRRVGSRRAAVALALTPVAALVAQLLLAIPASATPYTGTFGPTIIGELADLNGDGVVNGFDDANAFYGDTSIIDGQLDCNSWASTPNQGGAGDGSIDGNDDCELVGYDGTPDGVTIQVTDGQFIVGDGPLPTIFNASNPDLADISSADFAWSAIGGKVDSNGNEAIGANDCHNGVINTTVDSTGLGPFDDGAHILGNTSLNLNECGFNPPPAGDSDGLVDLNGDIVIDATDSCSDGCFFGLDVDNGFVQAPTPPPPPSTCPGFSGDPRNQVVGTDGDDTLLGTAGADIICGKGGNDTLAGRGGTDVVLGGTGSDTATGGLGADTLKGGSGPDQLSGGRGNDTLRGGTGNDALNGGPGFDTCRGGPGRDRVVRCEA